jgi:hypothetical protein
MVLRDSICLFSMSILVIICTPYSEKGIDGGAVQDVVRNRLSRAFIIATALIVGGQMMYFFVESAASLSILIATPM